MVARDCTKANTEGSTNRVAAVAAARPPITARPRGAFCWPDSPKASAMGSMPAIMAQVVIRMGRSRLPAPSTAAAVLARSREAASRGRQSRRPSAKVTSRMALAIATPTAMIAPMNDWMFSVVPVRQSITTTPAIAAGAVETVTSESRND